MEASAPLQASGPNHSFGAALKDIPMKFSPLLDEMMKALQVLPGVGPKSAQRMAFTPAGARGAAAACVWPPVQSGAHRNRSLQPLPHLYRERSLRDICANPGQARRTACSCVAESLADVGCHRAETGQFSAVTSC